MAEEVLYIANDVEATGQRLGYHDCIAFGACAITKEVLEYADYANKGLVFYAEIKPQYPYFNYELEAMKVGCSHLACLEEVKKKDPRYDVQSDKFDPGLVMFHLHYSCEEPKSAAHRFIKWIESVRQGKDIIGVSDTVFFDSGFINLLLGRHYSGASPYGWGGIDLDSLFRGYAGNQKASLRDLGLADGRKLPHRADHDAVFLAQIARVLLFEKLNW